jgi:hypothetical protein
VLRDIYYIPVFFWIRKVQVRALAGQSGTGYFSRFFYFGLPGREVDDPDLSGEEIPRAKRFGKPWRDNQDNQSLIQQAVLVFFFAGFLQDFMVIY